MINFAEQLTHCNVERNHLEIYYIFDIIKSMPWNNNFHYFYQSFLEKWDKFHFPIASVLALLL